jgi:hypothetical protein
MSSPTVSRVSSERKSYIPEVKAVSKTLDFCTELTRLITRENVITFSRRESSKSYVTDAVINTGVFTVLNNLSCVYGFGSLVMRVSLGCELG